MSASHHYDTEYFEWQRSIGEFGGWFSLHKFAPHIRQTDTVLDFGCGGGYLLSNIRCARKIGVEINPAARVQAKKNGVEVFETSAEVLDGIADVIVSDHALEHTTDPIGQLRSLYRKLRPGGKIVILIPCETHRWKYVPNDINYHLFSWGPMTFGNTLTEAGFHVIEVKPTFHKPPYQAVRLSKILPRPLFHLAGKIWAHLKRDWIEIKAVATKPL
jgi:SAM-dependent methyltransferase